MHYQTKLFQVSPHCHCVVVVLVLVVMDVVCGTYGDDGVVAQDVAHDDVAVLATEMFCNCPKPFDVAAAIVVISIVLLQVQ